MGIWHDAQINRLSQKGSMPLCAAEEIIKKYGSKVITEEDQEYTARIARALINAIKEGPSPLHLSELILALETVAAHEGAICQALSNDQDERLKDMGKAFLEKYHQ